MNIPDNWRVKLGSFYLDWAEKLPRFRGGIIAELQNLRERQRQDAKTAFQESRFPDGVSIELSYIRLAEIFLLEDTGQLKKGLRHLFPTINDKTGGEHIIGDFTSFATGLTSAGWKTIGLIVRQGNTTAGLSNIIHFRELPNLPPEVKCIEVQLHKFLSSSIILTFDIHLTQEVTARLLELHKQIYLPHIRFSKLAPWNLVSGGLSEGSPDTGVTDAILQWLKNLRIQVEKIIQPYFRGYFFNAPPNVSARLPAIEVFKLKGTPSKPEDLHNWLCKIENSVWWKSVGFNSSSSIYSDGNMAFIWPDERKSYFQPAYRFVVLQEDEAAPMKASLAVHSLIPAVTIQEDEAVPMEASLAVHSLIPAVTILELLRSVGKNIETLRMRTFQKMHPAPAKRWWLGSLIKQNNMVQRESMILDRVVMDVKQGTQWINYVTSEIVALKNLEPQRRKQEDANLQTMMLARVDSRTKLLGEHLSLIKKFSDGRLANLNIAVMYRLQIVAILLTIVGTFAAIIEIWKEWKHIKEFFCHLLN
jgi:hypothetical protein